MCQAGAGKSSVWWRFLEPIALYQTRDLLDDKDGGWMHSYPAPQTRVPFGQVGVQGDGTDLAIVSFANGFYLTCRAQAQLDAAGISTRAIDLRWLSPLPEAALLEAIAPCRNIIVVDETRRSGGVSESVVTLLAQHGRLAHRLAAEDSFIATGPAYGVTMPSVDADRDRRQGGHRMKTAVVICPGRGTYGAQELGYLARNFPRPHLLTAFDAARASLDMETLRALDGADRFSTSRHMRGDNASPLIFAARARGFPEPEP